MPCVADGRLSGIITETDVLRLLVDGRDIETPLAELMERRVSTMRMHDEASKLSDVFARGEVAIVIDDERRVLAVLTKMDLIDLVARRKSYVRASS